MFNASAEARLVNACHIKKAVNAVLFA